MTALTWDDTGKHFYEVGVDRGVLYIPDNSGAYVNGVAWNGLTTVTEKPAGAAANPHYADNIKYINIISAETFEVQVDAFTYPDEFAQCDGSYEPSPGLHIGQQTRKVFGLCYRTQVGNEVEGSDLGHKLHLVYGCLAAPSQKAYATINDNPAPIAFSWNVTTTPVSVSGQKPTSLLVIDSTLVDATKLGNLEDILYGTSSDDARLPLPDEVVTIFGAGETNVDLATAANQPTYNASTHIVTLPSVTGVQWQVNGANRSPGAQPALTTGQTAEVHAVAQSGYNLQGDDTWTFEY